MVDCTYKFTDAGGKERVIKGQAAFKAYLADGGLQHLMPNAAFSGKEINTADLPEDKQDILMSFFGEFGQDTPSRLPVRSLPVSAFPNVKLADGVNDERGESYARKMIGKEVPPIIVYGNTWLDGRHRVWAAKQEGKKTIEAIDLANLLPPDATKVIEPIAKLLPGTDVAFSGKEDTLNDKLQRKISADFGKAVEEYNAIEDTKGGRLIDTDLARQLSPEYRADRTLAPQVHKASSAFTQKLFDDRMAEAPSGGTVLFMAGGGGSGKSSAESLLASEFDRANTIMDGTLSSFEKADRNIQLALDNQQSVMIAYVYREPVEAMKNGVFKRAMNPNNGRTVTLDALAKGHSGSSEVIRKLQDKFGGNDLFTIKAIDNSRGPNNAAIVPLDQIPVVAEEGLKEKLQNATDEERQAGRISEAVYRSTTGSNVPGPAGRGESQAAGDEPGRGREVQRRAEPSQPAVSVSRAEQKNVKFGLDTDVTGAPIAFSQRQPMGKETEGWLLSRDATGRFRFGAGAKAYRYGADVANDVLDRIAMKPVSQELKRAMRKMRMEIDKAQNLTVDVAMNMKDLPQQEREMVSDVIEAELKRGAKPPKRVLEIAATMQSIMSEQSAELVRLGMLTPEAAGRWDGKYLPRFYEQKLGDETKAWMKAVKGLLGRKKTMQGIGGSSLKARGMFESVPVADLADWEANGWAVRDDSFDPAVDDQITVWRDYTRTERDDMGEIRDSMFRFVMGYNKSQRDVALGRLYENLASNYASRTEQEGYVQVPSTNVEDTYARRYGKLAGKWVPKEILDQLVAFDTTMQNDLLKMYLKGLSMWKEGKTVLNPVAHANNVMSNITMAHFAGVSYWDGHKYVGAIKDLVKNDAMVTEAQDAGLFSGTFSHAELMDAMPEQLRALAQMSESKAKKAVDMIWNALSLFLRKPLGKAYASEDNFFRYMIYRDARNKGLDPDDAVDYALQYMFSYDDMPKGARIIRDVPIGLPFFAYTYNVVPALAKTALEQPWRYAAPAVALYTINAAMYAMAASLGGGEDEDWWTVIQRYLTDPEFRDRAKQMEEQERKNLPPWQKGESLMLGTEKTIRLGTDDMTNLPVFLDVSRIFPGGDIFDAHNNAGGMPIIAPLMPNSPVLTTIAAIAYNEDTFRGRDITDKTDTSVEAAAKRAAFMWRQMTPAIAVGNTHFERAMNVIANVTGEVVKTPLGSYTGIGKDGVPIMPGYAAMQTVGIKARPIDLAASEKFAKAEQKRMVTEINIKMSSLRKQRNKGSISDETAEVELEKLREKKRNLNQGLTVEGEEKD